MIDATFNRGKGNAKGGVEYVLSDKSALVDKDNNFLLDESGRKQFVTRDPLPEIVRGDPQLTINLIDGLDFKNRYTSGALSWEHGEEVSIEKEIEIIEAWEKVHFPSMESDRYNILWVRHEHAGHHELHYIIPKVDLETGKYLNPKPPSRDYALSNTFRRIVNLENGWSDPSDHGRKQLSKVATNEEIKSGFNQKAVELRKTLTDAISDRIEVGMIESWQDIKDMFDDLDLKITRQGQSKGTPYVSIKTEEMTKAVRLKGAFYDTDFRVESEIKNEIGTRAERDVEDIEAELRELKQRLEKLVSERAEFNEKRYVSNHKLDEIRNEFDSKTSRGYSRKSETEVVATGTLSDRDLSGYLSGKLGMGAISAETNNELSAANLDVKKSNRSLQQEQGLDKNEHMRQERVRSDRPNGTRISGWIQDIKKIIGSGYERIRTEFKQWINGISLSRESTISNHDEANKIIVRSSANLEQSIQSNSKTIERGIEVMRENRADELERFKTEINLVDYLSRNGFEYDKKASCQNSVVMRKADEKLVISTDAAGHGIYFDVKNDNNNGTIIDWVQKNLNKNLGQVRKELRLELNISEPEQRKIFKPKAISKDLSKVIYAFGKMSQISESAYLKSRGINRIDKRFNVYQDRIGNVVFPHFTSEKSLTGFEKKNQDFTGFSSGGEKCLFVSNNINSGEKVYICESAIDALSLAKMQNDRSAAYISIGGKMSAKQKTELGKLLQGKNVVCAFDNDRAGKEYIEDIKAILKDDSVTYIEPEHAKDWNDLLVADMQQKQLVREQVAMEQVAMEKKRDNDPELTMKM